MTQYTVVVDGEDDRDRIFKQPVESCASTLVTNDVGWRCSPPLCARRDGSCAVRASI
jgi:hypothetical protein